MGGKQINQILLTIVSVYYHRNNFYESNTAMQ